MLEQYYRERLYPLQDKVCAKLASAGSAFYLTGGTALSREYFNHRYSDDLDFFCNDNPDFPKASEQVVALLGSDTTSLTVGTTTDTFVRLYLREGDIELKVDLVNDVPFHAGEILCGQLFSRIDNPLNVLSNKISALPRSEAKDVVDIIWIARNYAFNWMKIIEEAKQKDLWVDELDVSGMLSSFPADALKSIRWVAPVDISRCMTDLKQIANDIAFGADNGAYSSPHDSMH